MEESPLFGFVDERVRHVRWTEEAVIESVARWLEQLAPDAPRTQKAYLAWSIGHPDRAAPSTIGNFGGFVGVRMAAERLLAERAAAA